MRGIGSCWTVNYAMGDCVGCRACPINAQCNGTSIVPTSGWWISHPRSSQVHLCPYQPACTRKQTQQADLLAVAERVRMQPGRYTAVACSGRIV